MSLAFKYWIEFDEEGDIKYVHKSKYDCEGPCKEYLVKLIPIKRDKNEELSNKVEKQSSDLIQETEALGRRMRQFRTELDKTVRGLKRIKIK